MSFTDSAATRGSDDNRTEPVEAGGVLIGGREFVVIAGPCAIESEAQLLNTARAVADHGASLLRGGLFKLRTDPRSFQGLGLVGIDIAKAVRAATGLGLCAEITDPRHIEPLSDVVDIFQVGARNMHNYALLKELGQQSRPVLLKRGLSALIDEWLLAAEYLKSGGNSRIILCERGIRTFERRTRNTLDLSAVAYVKRHTSFPVLVDPSHGTGVPELMAPLCRAAAAVGADGLLIEVHIDPETARSDGEQALSAAGFAQAMAELRPILFALGRPLSGPPANRRSR